MDLISDLPVDDDGDDGDDSGDNNDKDDNVVVDVNKVAQLGDVTLFKNAPDEDDDDEDDDDDDDDEDDEDDEDEQKDKGDQTHLVEGAKTKGAAGRHKKRMPEFGSLMEQFRRAGMEEPDENEVLKKKLLTSFVTF